MDAGMLAVQPSPAARALKIALLLTAAGAGGVTAAQAAGIIETTIVGTGSYLSGDGLTAAIYSGVGDTTIWTAGGSPTFAGIIPTGISADGTAVIGFNTQNIAVWISGGTVHTLGVLNSDVKSMATGVSADGSVVVGYSTDNTPDRFEHAFWWTPSGGLVALPILFDLAVANGVSADGKTIVGASHYGPDAYSTPIRWTIDAQGIATIHELDGNVRGEARGISADGSTIFGTSEIYGDADGRAVPDEHAFRWTTSNPVVEDLMPVVPSGYDVIPHAASPDGSVIIGNLSQHSFYGDGSMAFRWTETTGLVELGNLSAFPHTSTYAAALSADGSVVVGTSDDGNDQTSHAFRWTEQKGMVAINDLLTGAGVELGSDSLETASGVSADGKIVIGDARTKSGRVFYVANLDGVDAAGGTGSSGGGGSPAVITGDVIGASFASLAAPGAGNGDHLGSIFDEFDGLGPSRGDGPSAFASGGFDTDPAKSGSLGVTLPLGAGISLGLIVDAGKLTSDLAYGGSSDFTTGAAAALLARNANTGIQFFLGAGGDLFAGTVARGYLDGMTPVTSTGSTGGYGYGARGQLGRRIGDGREGASLMPFVSGTVATTRIRGYTESGGPFPASIGDLRTTTTELKAGLEARFADTSGFAVSARLAAVHSVIGTGPISGTVAGLLALDGTAATTVTDWLETGAGLSVPMGPAVDASLGVLARFPTHGARSFASQAGLRVSF